MLLLCSSVVFAIGHESVTVIQIELNCTPVASHCQTVPPSADCSRSLAARLVFQGREEMQLREVMLLMFAHNPYVFIITCASTGFSVVMTSDRHIM